MYLTDILFEPLRDDHDPKLVLDAVEGYLIGLRKSWQIEGPYTFGWVGGAVRATVSLALPDALAHELQDDPASRDLESLRALSHSPKWTVLEDSKRERRRRWEGEAALFLFTHMFDFLSPICAGSDGASIPPYLLPSSAREREAIYFWASSYRCHDEIQIACGGLEIPAYGELARPNSVLSTEGRRICRDIEAATGIPTYYYLMRYWGRREGEASRVCPSCGEPWNNAHAADDCGGIDRFEFRCEPCRLVSNVASSYEDERHARIGEYRAPRGK